MNPALEIRDVAASYGPFRALFGVSLTVPAGGSLALLGSNGAGKTSVARVASGLVAPTSGSVRVDGDDLTGARPYRYAQAGVAHAPEGRSVFATLTVGENLTLAFRRAYGASGVPGALNHAYELFPRLAERRSQMAGTLSGGEQRMLSMARVLVATPKVLIADELSLGLAPIIIDEVYRTLQTILEAGTALLIVEQQVGHALELCDRVAVLSHGVVKWEGPSTEATDVVVGQVFTSDEDG